MTPDYDASRVAVYLDEDPDPIGIYRPPARFQLDTEALEDGPHELRIVATDASRRSGVRKVAFTVRNGPGIALDGLADGDVVEGTLSLMVNAYGAAYEEHWEPARAETPAPIPTWAWVLFLGTLSWATFYALRAWSPPPDMAVTPTYGARVGSHVAAKSSAGAASTSATEASSGAGSALYAANCASCHQGNGQGVPGVFPPLAGDPVVTAGDPTQHIHTILFGVQGRAIGGVDYAAPMPPWGDRFTDSEIADIVNHERTSWGNSAPRVTDDDVAAVRGAGPDVPGGER